MSYSQIDYLKKSLDKLEPIVGLTPSLQSKFRIILEGEFKQPPETLWAAIESIANNRFEFSKHVVDGKLVITGKSIYSPE